MPVDEKEHCVRAFDCKYIMDAEYLKLISAYGSEANPTSDRQFNKFARI